MSLAADTCVGRERETLYRELSRLSTRDGKPVLPSARSDSEKLGIFKMFLEHRLYTAARFYADSLLSEDFPDGKRVPITSIRYHAFEYFDSLRLNGHANDRIEMAFLFEEPYLFHLWLDKIEEADYLNLKRTHHKLNKQKNRG